MTVQEKLAKHALFDVAILSHGFSPYMRDYDIVAEVGGTGQGVGTYLYRFTHCTEAHYATRVSDNAWRASWNDTYINYESWMQAGQPEGFVWGTQWSMAYPGLAYIEDSELASHWSSRLQASMHEVSIETEAFSINLVFHDVFVTKLSGEVSIIDKAVIPLN
ncbi:MAG: hypothetical protein IVW55_06060 [Chloroflexi bacterium]|nr:hypothetical protein [Chloroflexota bacterium]